MRVGERASTHYATCPAKYVCFCLRALFTGRPFLLSAPISQFSHSEPQQFLDRKAAAKSETKKGCCRVKRVRFQLFTAAPFCHSGQHAKPERLPGTTAKTGVPVYMLGLGVARLRADMNRLLAMLLHQGVLDEQFLQLQQLQDESSPNFVNEVVNIYFQESEKLLRNLRALLMDREFTDYSKMGIHLNQLIGSSSSIGAKRLKHICVAFRATSEQHNRSGCLRALELLEHEYCYLKNKLHELFQIEQQRVLAAGVRYPMQQNI